MLLSIRERATSTIIWTTVALVAFAANSVLCRVALRETTIDPATFSTIRLISGAVMLLLVTSWRQAAVRGRVGSWTSAALLALYAVPFSFAYASLSTGTGALILFGSVQLTMLCAALTYGERLHTAQWAGIGTALAGLVILVFPGLNAPSPVAAFLMTVAGVSWGVYSWRGRGTTDPVRQTTSNFVRAVPFVAAVSLLTVPGAHVESAGVVLAIASGAVTSGLGYVAWFAALRGLTGMQAAVVQLSVPVLAAGGGVLFLAEAVSLRLVVSTIVVLGGIALAVVGREFRRRWS